MRKLILATSLSLVFGALLAGSVQAGEIVYVPVNPNFGGNPFNAGPLQTNASSQNGFSDPNALQGLPGLSGLGTPASQENRVSELVQNALATSSLRTLVDSNGFFIVGRSLTTGGITYSVTAGTPGSGINFVTSTNNATGATSVFPVAAP